MSFPNRNLQGLHGDTAPAFLAANAPSFPAPPPSTPPQARADDPQVRPLHHRKSPGLRSHPHMNRSPRINSNKANFLLKFDIFSWQPKYASCQRYFLDHAQHSGPVQAVAAFLNIHLPFQRDPPTLNSAPTRASPLPHPASSASSSSSGGPSPAVNMPFQPAPAVSLTPYLRRLVVTGLDFPGVLHGFFGDDWATGIGPLHEQERRNYLFAAKSGGWAGVKRDYDMLPLETVPFVRPLQGVVEQELVAAERSWSEWLALEDWMVGPRAPEGEQGSSGPTAQGR